MSDFNLPDGCMVKQIDRDMFVDDRSCFDCLFWNPIEYTNGKVGICEILFNGMDMGDFDIVERIANYAATTYNDYCGLWKYFENQQ